MKSGGDFDTDYVFSLREGVANHLSSPHKFVCYTDLTIPGMSIRFLTENLNGWFAKFEIFKELGPCLYIDLDTVIVGDLDPLAQSIIDGGEAFWMLEAFSPLRMWASGIMGWTGDWSWLMLHCKRYAGLYQMDQDCIAKALKDAGREPHVIGRDMNKIYSYKHHCGDGLPDDARIVCFHGKPRPRDVKEEWVRL
jgi:hypothetical protein